MKWTSAAESQCDSKYGLIQKHLCRIDRTDFRSWVFFFVFWVLVHYGKDYNYQCEDPHKEWTVDYECSTHKDAQCLTGTGMCCDVLLILLDIFFPFFFLQEIFESRFWIVKDMMYRIEMDGIKMI